MLLVRSLVLIRNRYHTMTYFEEEVERIRNLIYSNQVQLDTVIATRRYINEHYDTVLNLEVLSRELLVSKYHLLRLFKRYYGQTPQQYLSQKRIEKAKEHLREGMRVTEVCYAVGFQSLGSFSTLFKKKTGSSPHEFQKRATFKK